LYYATQGQNIYFPLTTEEAFCYVIYCCIPLPNLPILFLGMFSCIQNMAMRQQRFINTNAFLAAAAAAAV
jgi:hypothetical protein